MLLKRLLTDDPTPHAGDTLDAFWPKHTAWVESLELPIDRAIIGSLRADRVGFAFVAGYRAALYALAPAVGRHELVALSATEAGGNHPRAIHTKLENGRLSGRKRWTTLGGRAASVLVVASVGQDDTGRNRLKVARVPVDRAGVRVVPMGDAPFVPEIPHAELYFDDVEVRDDELLPGDALVRRSNGAGHVFLFLGWNDSAKSSMCVLEQASTALDMEYRSRPTASLKATGYRAIRSERL